MKKITFKQQLIMCAFILISTLSNAQTTVSLIAGNANGAIDGTGINARFFLPSSIVKDIDGNYIVADYSNHLIRKVTPSGVVTTIAGYYQGDSTGSTYSALFNNPFSVATDNLGNIYVADSGNHKIKKISTTGQVTTVAGSTSGYVDGQGTSAKFRFPTGLTVDNNGVIYVSDDNHRIRKISSTGLVTTLAGGGFGDIDGTGTNAMFNLPYGLKLDAEGNLYVADSGNHKIKKISSTGVVTTIAGTELGYENGSTSVAKFNHPYSIDLDGLGNIYIADTGNHKIRKLATDGEVSDVAGSTRGYLDGDAAIAKFNSPRSLILDSTGNIIVADTYNDRIRKISFESLASQDFDKEKIKIYPNPTSDFLIIKGNEKYTNINYEILTMDGRLIKKGTLNDFNTQINLRDIAKGNYLISITDGKNSNTYKVIKN